MRSALLLLAVLLAAPAVAGLSREEWRVARAIVLPKLSRPAQVYLPLDREALAADSLSEYRVVRAGKMEAPYRMMLESGLTESHPVPDQVVEWTTKQDAAGQDTSATIVLDLGEQRPAVNRLEFAFAGDAYRCRVRVEERAQPAAEGKELFNAELYRQGPSFQRTVATFPDSRERYLRVTVTRTQGKGFRVERVSPFHVLDFPRRLEPVPAKLKQTEEAKQHRTVLDLDLEKPSRDLAVLELTVAEPAFDRQAWLEVSRKEQPEYEMAQIVQLRRLSANQPAALHFEVERARRLRLTIDNGDDKPLTIASAALSRVRRGLIFTADPRWEYQLWYGNVRASRPQYELERLPLTTPPGELPLATLGVAQVIPPKPPPPPPWTESHPGVFYAALGVVVLLLALIIVKAIRSVKGTAGA
jgi:hypothetical protein